MKILVTGGTGFVGRHVVSRLVNDGHEVHVASRRADKASGLPDGVVRHRANVKNPEDLLVAARGVEAIVHLVGIIVEGRGQSFAREHVDATRHVVEVARTAGIARLLHMSALGTRANARSDYHATKYQAEELVRSSDLQWTIFQPSLIFGPGDEFIPLLKQLTLSPLVPVIGDGTAPMQPIWVGDVATAIVRTLTDDTAVHHTYQLGGPEVVTLESMVDLVLQTTGRRRKKVHVPLSVMYAKAKVLRVLPKPPISRDQLIMLEEGNVCEGNNDTVQLVDGPLGRLEDIVPTYV